MCDPDAMTAAPLEPVRVDAAVTREDIDAACRWDARRSGNARATRGRRIRLVIFIAPLVVAAAALQASDGAWHDWVLYGALLLALVGSQLGRHDHAHAAGRASGRFEISASGISLTRESSVRTKAPWPAIAATAIGPDHLFVSLGDQGFWVLPRRCFASPGDVDRALALIDLHRSGPTPATPSEA